MDIINIVWYKLVNISKLKYNTLFSSWVCMKSSILRILFQLVSNVEIDDM